MIDWRSVRDLLRELLDAALVFLEGLTQR